MKISIISKNKSVIYKLLAVIGAILLWQGISSAVAMPLIVVSPAEVARRLWELIFERDFFVTVLYSLLRIGSGFLLSLFFGTAMAILSGKSKAAEYILWPYVAVIKAVPVASFIIMCLLWMNFTGLTVFISFLISFPAVYSNVLTGIKSTDKKLLEMADVYKMPYRGRLHYIYIPAVKPYLLSACGISAGMSWKAGVAAEVIGVVNGSVGGKLYEAKIYLQSADLFAWTAVIVALSVAVEKLTFFLLKKVFSGVEKR